MFSLSKYNAFCIIVHSFRNYIPFYREKNYTYTIIKYFQSDTIKFRENGDLNQWTDWKGSKYKIEMFHWC